MCKNDEYYGNKKKVKPEMGVKGRHAEAERLKS